MKVKIITGELAKELDLMRFWHEIRSRYLYVGWVDGRRFKRAVRRAAKLQRYFTHGDLLKLPADVQIDEFGRYEGNELVYLASDIDRN